MAKTPRITQDVAGIGKVPRGGGSTPVKGVSGNARPSSGPIRGKATNPSSPSMAFGTGMTQGTKSVNGVTPTGPRIGKAQPSGMGPK